MERSIIYYMNPGGRYISIDSLISVLMENHIWVINTLVLKYKKCEDGMLEAIDVNLFVEYDPSKREKFKRIIDELL